MQITRHFVFPSNTSRGRNELVVSRAHLEDAKKNCNFYLYEICQLFLMLETIFIKKIY